MGSAQIRSIGVGLVLTGLWTTLQPSAAEAFGRKPYDSGDLRQEVAAQILGKQPPESLRILTFNTWGMDLPMGYGATLVEARIGLLPPHVIRTGADIVCLQEVWRERDRDTLRIKMAELGYTYSFDGARISGNGLLVVSKYPILTDTSDGLIYRRDTRFDERFVEKGVIALEVALARSESGELSKLHLLVTHTGAVTYDSSKKEFDPENQAALLSQLQQLYGFIARKGLHHTQEPVVLAGDLNLPPLVLTEGVFEDRLTPHYLLFAGREPGGLGWIDTLDTPNWMRLGRPGTWSRENPNVSGGQFAADPEMVLDYLFVNRNSIYQPETAELALNTELTVIEKLKLKLDGRFALSDHYGLIVSLKRK